MISFRLGSCGVGLMCLTGLTIVQTIEMPLRDLWKKKITYKGQTWPQKHSENHDDFQDIQVE